MTKENQRSIPFGYKLIAGLLSFAAMFVIAMVFGAADTTIGDVWLAIASDATGDTLSMIREIRLPREIGAIFVGSALAVAGAIMQGMTKNPLADPGLLGLTAGANAALAVAIALLPSANSFHLMIACFIGAAIGAILVFGMGAMKKAAFLHCASSWPVLPCPRSCTQSRKVSAFTLKFPKTFPCGPLAD